MPPQSKTDWHTRDLREMIESSPLCIIDLFQNSLFLIYIYFFKNLFSMLISSMICMHIFSVDAKILKK